jgi:hypothetical protein
MVCEKCNGLVIWMGPLVNLTHTECQNCGGINCQRVDDDRDDLDDQDDYLQDLEDRERQ